MNKYPSPKITVVALDPNQSVLEVCKVEGIYMYAVKATTACWFGVSTHAARNCNTAVRGQLGTSSCISSSHYSFPS
ncbi:MAG: hypothetical protein PHQ52_06220 [Candidatus Omnitrophica bacterium]|nr:hypothetical protein [Candidatus Omnitrophota bacterium]